MPVPKPKPSESQKDFISRCMADSVMSDEYKNIDQRNAVCNTAWKDRDMNNSKHFKSENALDAEIFAVGFWNGLDFTVEDLKVIANSFDALKKVHKVPLKFGHNDEQPMTDGQPALGWVENIWLAGEKLMARFVDVPDEVFTAMEKKLYRHVSVELDMGVEHKGNFYSWVLSGVALLGADIPAVNTLADLTSYMGKDELAFAKRMVFTAIENDREDFKMDTDNEKVNLLKAKVEAQKIEMSKLITTNAALEKEIAEMKVKFKGLEEADIHRQRTDERTALMSRLDGLVGEKKITPATRDDFMRDFDEIEDSKVVLFAVDKMEKTINSNPAYFGAEQAREKAKREAEENETSADKVVVARAREYQAKHAESNFSVAKRAVLLADPELAERYTKREA